VGPARVLHPRAAPASAPRRLLPFREGSRRHRRALDRLDDRADNGPGTGPYEGLSLAVGPDGAALVPLDEIVARGGADVVGERLWTKFGGWTAYAKFFDNLFPLPFHVHAPDEKAAAVGKFGKPEAYYYPPQMNNYLGTQSVSYLGLRPDVTKDDLRDFLEAHSQGGDNKWRLAVSGSASLATW